MIEGNKYLVDQVVRQFKNVRSADREDLRGAGYFGLIAAVDKWDPMRMPWERFARLKIKYAMVDQIREMSWVPKGLRAEAERIDFEEETLASELGRQPTTEELAARLEKHPDELVTLLVSIRATDWNVASIDWRRDTEIPWLETVVDKSSVGEDPAHLAERLEEIDRLELILQRLTGRERFVIKWRFFAYPRKTQAEIAKLLGVHESRVSQIVDAAIERARLLVGQPWVLFPEVYSNDTRITRRI